jgi:hypothetical protein
VRNFNQISKYKHFKKDLSAIVKALGNVSDFSSLKTKASERITKPMQNKKSIVLMIFFTVS